MKEHDVILDFNGNRVEGTEQLTRMIRETPPGREVALGISRDGQPMQLKVTLGDRSKELASTRVYHNAPRIMIPAMPEPPEMPEVPDFNFNFVTNGTNTGALVDNLTPQLGDYFGVKGGAGVLVKSVEKGSAAETAGLKAGDVIVKAEGDKIENRSDWRRVVRARKSGKLAVTVVRDKREQPLTLTLPEPRHRDSSAMRGILVEPDDLDIDIDLDMAMDQVREIQPILEREIINVGPQIQREMLRVKPQIERQMKEMKKELERSLQNIKLEFET